MTSDCRERTTCRLCESPRLETVIELTPTPPANAFVPADRRAAPQASYPLVVNFCDDCHHVQLGHVVDPEILFRDYVYVSGTSPVFRAHFADYAERVIERAGLRPGSQVIDIGSNDGTLLEAFRGAGMRVLGIDPARAIAETATARGIETLAEFFTPDLAAGIARSHGTAHAITANNVLAHVDDLASVIDGVRCLLHEDGVFVFEVSYLADVIEKVLFDTIYHEHLDYHTLGPLIGFFERHGMRVVGAERVASHGGSIRIFVRHGAHREASAPEVGEITAAESKAGLGDAATYRGFSRRIDALGAALFDMLKAAKSEEKRIAGYGAPAKATTLLHHFGLGGLLDFIVDDSPLKQGLFSPGHHIPVVPVADWYAARPEETVVLAWNFADAIISNHQAYIDDGGRFIVPLPELRTVP